MLRSRPCRDRPQHRNLLLAPSASPRRLLRSDARFSPTRPPFLAARMAVTFRRIGTLGSTIPVAETAFRAHACAQWVTFAGENDFRLSEGVALLKKGVAMRATISALGALLAALAL